MSRKHEPVLGPTYRRLTQDEFIALVQKTTGEICGSQKLGHPVDIMTTITLANETLFQFFFNLPHGCNLMVEEE